MQHGEVLVSVEEVSKKFCKDLRTSLGYGVQDLFGQVAGRFREGVLRPKEFWAVQEVSFEVRRGECIGLVGRNGAGKTTLLRMLNGLIKPDKGRITMRGRVGALIALGAGFNGVLTGRENIYVNGAVLGLSKREIDERFDEIVDFSGLGDFIDSPVQSYSSGMSVRLGYAIASTLEPDVLILDEVLAVGDEAFRVKCYQRIARMMENTAVILVSHNMDHIGSICSSVLMMRNGRHTHYRNTVDGIAAYFDANEAGPGAFRDGQVHMFYPPVTAIEATVLEPGAIEYGGRMSVELKIISERAISGALFSFTLVDQQHRAVMCWSSERGGTPIDLERGQQLIRLHIDPLLLHEGLYTWNLSMRRQESIENLIHLTRAGEVKVKSRYRPVSSIPYLPNASSIEVVRLTL